VLDWAFEAEAKGEGSTSPAWSRSQKSIENSTTQPVSAPVASMQWDVDHFLLSIQPRTPTWTPLFPGTARLAAV